MPRKKSNTNIIDKLIEGFYQKLESELDGINELEIDQFLKVFNSSVKVLSEMLKINSEVKAQESSAIQKQIDELRRKIEDNPTTKKLSLELLKQLAN